MHHTYATAGSRTVTVRAVSAGGTSADKTAQIAVTPVPVKETTTPSARTTPVVGAGQQPTVPQAPAGPQLPSEATVRAALATFPKAPVTTLATLLKKGVTFQQLFPGAGKVVWQLYLGRPSGASAAKATKPVAIGTARKTVTGAGAVKVTIKVSARRRAAVRKAGRRAKVYVKTTFTDAAGRRFVAVRSVRLKH